MTLSTFCSLDPEVFFFFFSTSFFVAATLSRLVTGVHNMPFFLFFSPPIKSYGGTTKIPSLIISTLPHKFIFRFTSVPFGCTILFLGSASFDNGNWAS